MKNLGKIFLLAFVQAGVILALPLFVGGSGQTVDHTAPVSATAVMSAITPTPVLEAEQTVDSGVLISVLHGNERTELPLDQYLFGVVAAEMPASFESEALKAQAVAARSYALYRVRNGIHDGSICTDAACCEAWLSEETLREKWGADFENYAAKLRSAVAATDGQCLLWEGEPILAAFHSSSGGFTENSENVFSKALPYLVSVSSPESSAEVPNFVTTVTLSSDELYAAIAAWNEEAAIQVSQGMLITDAVYSTTGRLLNARLGGQTVSGSELRKILGLRSAMVSWQRQEDGVVFTVTGYGHGVGMSQYGANTMAKNGFNYAAILNHYYPGADLSTIRFPSQNETIL